MDSAQLKSDASAALAAGDFARAGTLFACYCAGAPSDRQSLLRMGDAWARAGERARAIDAYLAAAQGFAADGFLARAIAASKLVLELEPGHQRMQRILADLYAQRGVGPGVGRRPRAVSPPPSPPPEASEPPPAVPAAPAAAEEEPAELVVTEFILETRPAERSLEDVLAEAVGARGAPAQTPPAAEASIEAPPLLLKSPLPADTAPSFEKMPEPATPGPDSSGARFHELSLDETELTPPPPPPPAPSKAPLQRFALAEPGPPSVAVHPTPAEPVPPSHA